MACSAYISEALQKAFGLSWQGREIYLVSIEIYLPTQLACAFRLLFIPLPPFSFFDL